MFFLECESWTISLISVEERSVGRDGSERNQTERGEKAPYLGAKKKLPVKGEKEEKCGGEERLEEGT